MIKKMIGVLSALACVCAVASTALADGLPPYNVSVLPEEQLTVTGMDINFDSNGDPIIDYDSSVTRKLEYGLNFSAVETDVSSSPYKNYDADFTVTFDKDILHPDDIKLYGAYGDYSVFIPLAANADTEIKAGEPIRLLGSIVSAADARWTVTYKDIVNTVKSFNCGVIRVNNAGHYDDVWVTVSLNLYAPGSDEPLVVGERRYQFPRGYVEEADDTGFVYTDEEQTVKSGVMRFLYHIDTAHEIKKAGVVLASSIANLQSEDKSVTVEADGLATFYADVVNIPEGSTKPVFSLGYVVVNDDETGERYIVTEPYISVPNFERRFVDYK